MARIWTDAEYDLLREKYPFLPLSELVLLLGKPESVIRSAAKRLKLYKINKTVHYGITPDEEEFIINNYSVMTASQIANELGFTLSKVKNQIARLDLSLPDEIRQKRKQIGQIKQGNIPFNKGLKMELWASRETIEIFRKNQYKKGNLPHNTKTDGFITIRRDPDGRFYKWIRISLNNWIHLHRYVWQNSNGEIPKNSVVRFIDGNTMNCDVLNLELISKDENLRINRRNALKLVRVLFMPVTVREINRNVKIEKHKLEKEHQRAVKKSTKRAAVKKKGRNKIDKIKDYGSITIKSDSPFFQSINTHFSPLFAMALSRTKNKELAQDLVHEMIARFNDHKEHDLVELTQFMKVIFKEDNANKNRINTNEKIFYVIPSEESFEHTTDEIEQDVQIALSSLNNVDYEISRLFFFEDYSMNEISEELSIESSELEERIDQIKKILKIKLIKYKQ